MPIGVTLTVEAGVTIVFMGDASGLIISGENFSIAITLIGFVWLCALGSYRPFTVIQYSLFTERLKNVLYYSHR